jgi:hypothetical protein
MLGGEWMTLHKIFPLGKGGYVAGAGYYDQVVEIADWLNKGADPDSRPVLPENAESTILIVDEEGACHWLTWPYLRPIKVDEPFIAIGSGAQYAMGAMAAGANALKAVEIANTYDPSSGRGVQVVRCGPRPKRNPKRKETLSE